MIFVLIAGEWGWTEDCRIFVIHMDLSDWSPGNWSVRRRCQQSVRLAWQLHHFIITHSLYHWSAWYSPLLSVQ